MDESLHYCLRAPAREIRLFNLVQTGDLGQPIANVRRTTIAGAPPFIAVSHVWGRRENDRHVHLDSGCGPRSAKISTNLDALFARLLRDDPSTLPDLFDSSGSRLPLWIDMMCINQYDTSEKAMQIPLMREVYSKALCVVIWINEDSLEVPSSFRYIHKLAGISKINTTNTMPEFDASGWSAIKYLLEREWFRRRWVLQELTVARNAVFLCASEVIAADDFFLGIEMAVKLLFARPRAMKMLHMGHSGHVRPAMVIKQLKVNYDQPEQRVTLLWLLEKVRFTKATLAHDQIYSLLGLCTPEEVAANPIRYDVDAQEVYKTFVRSHAQLYQDLEFLGLCTPVQRDSLTSGSPETLETSSFTGPSWVPNWHSSKMLRALGCNSLEPEHAYFKASRAVPATLVFHEDELVASAIRVDQIARIGDFSALGRASELKDPDSELFQQFFDFWKGASEVDGPYGDRLSFATTFARTLSLLGIYLDPVPALENVPKAFARWADGSRLGRQLAEYGLEPDGEMKSDDVDSRDERTAFLRMKRLMSWEPFISQKGYIGLARQHSCVGDEIWLVGGSSVPILLSPRAGKYEVKGEVFLDGFMFGEHPRTGESDQWPVQSVTLI